MPMQRTPAEVVMLVRPEHRGRVTGFGVACAAHGAMPVLAPSKAAAMAAAESHADDQHAGQRVEVLVHG